MSAAGGLYELCDKDDERGGGCNQQHAGWGMRGRAGWAWTWELMIFRRTDAVAARRDRGSGQSTCLCRLLFSGSSLRADVFARRIALAFSFSLIFFFCSCIIAAKHRHYTIMDPEETLKRLGKSRLGGALRIEQHAAWMMPIGHARLGCYVAGWSVRWD